MTDVLESFLAALSPEYATWVRGLRPQAQEDLAQQWARRMPRGQEADAGSGNDREAADHLVHVAQNSESLFGGRYDGGPVPTL